MVGQSAAAAAAKDISFHMQVPRKCTIHNHYDDISNPKLSLSTSTPAQIRLRDIQQVARTILGGKSSASLPMWPSEATKRLFVLCLSTVGLLFVRLQIMGSQLPVFTR